MIVKSYIKFLISLVIVSILFSCAEKRIAEKEADLPVSALAEEVKNEMIQAWSDYKEYAWGYDVLLPLSKKGFNWYEESLGISPYDAYSTLKVMGLDEEAKEIEEYALSMDWDKDVYVQVFEVNIRILGGLLAIYEYTKNPAVLEKVKDFGDRILPAFNSPTGLPYHSVNLRTGKTAGDKGKGPGNEINVAQAATYLFEFGILSYYTEDPIYYQTARKATKAIFEQKSEIGLPGEQINVETGEWVGTPWHHLQAGCDSYYEYMYKASLIFPDPEIVEIWNYSIDRINKYLVDDFKGRRYYTIVDMHTGEILKRSVSLYDAFFPAIQALSGDIESAEKNQQSWDWLWDKYGLLPTRYHYGKDTVEYANSELNPEIIESAYYLHQITGKEMYLDMVKKYWKDLNICCKTDGTFHSIQDVRSKAKKDYLATYFYAETLKYFYIAFAGKEVFDFDQHVFNTEAHSFRRDSFDPELAKVRLGYE